MSNSAEYMRAYNVANRERLSAYHKAYREEHRDERLEYHKKWWAKNKEKQSAKRRAVYARDPDAQFDAKLRQSYSLSKEDHEQMWNSQGGKCYFCDSDIPRRGRGVHVDHDHDSGRVRGLACRDCNVYLIPLVERGHPLVANLRDRLETL